MLDVIVQCKPCKLQHAVLLVEMNRHCAMSAPSAGRQAPCSCYCGASRQRRQPPALCTPAVKQRKLADLDKKLAGSHFQPLSFSPAFRFKRKLLRSNALLLLQHADSAQRFTSRELYLQHIAV
jgi:hypothetical protein